MPYEVRTEFTEPSILRSQVSPNQKGTEATFVTYVLKAAFNRTKLICYQREVLMIAHRHINVSTIPFYYEYNSMVATSQSLTIM